MIIIKVCVNAYVIIIVMYLFYFHKSLTLRGRTLITRVSIRGEGFDKTSRNITRGLYKILRVFIFSPNAGMGVQSHHISPRGRGGQKA